MTAHTLDQHNKPRRSGPGLSPRLILLIFALVMALLYTLASRYTVYEMGHDQTYLGTMLAKDRDPTLFLRDYAFHDDSLYRSYIPSVRGLFAGLSRLCGGFEPALFCLTPVVVFLFTLGTGLLLYQWSQSLGIALVLTLLAVPYRPAPAGEIWGAGGVEYLLARTMATSLAPFVFMIFCRWLAQPTAKGAARTGVATGLLAYLHPPTALFLGEFFAGVYLLNHFWGRRDWLFLALMLAGFFGVAWFPMTLKELQAPANTAAALDFAALRQVVQSFLKIPDYWWHFTGDPTERRVWLFLGATLLLGGYYLARPANREQAARQVWGWGNLVILYLCWRVAGKGAGFTWLYLVAAVYVIWRYRRGDLEPQDWWLLTMGFVVLAISILPYYVFTLLWLKIDSLWLTALVMDHYRAVRLVHPFFYLFSARAAQCLIPAATQWLGATRRTVLVDYAVLAVTMGSRGLFGLALGGMVVREAWRQRPRWRQALAAGLLGLSLAAAVSLVLVPAVRQGVSAWAGRDLKLGAARVDLRADKELYTWARTQTPKDALFFYGSPFFRYQAQRSITHALDLINHREARYVEIFRRYHRLEKAFEDSAALLREAEALQADYIVVEKSRQMPLPLPVAFQNVKYLVYQLTPGAAGKGESPSGLAVRAGVK